ncbi:ABC-F family ATP-binding cassette domain-containing protein [Caulobacter sp. NIBR1757]|uniref:ABC-F family ATP-binding cassette domain-containing protein n=1 Tax=Caulobacter sp. NIBR1757 TaxID=3016000 RepID=UPI0022F01963|nr:ABC-F family ATP-binding cassette domain-containing protein [Caulobacter sp. NIBR1757]WGM39861.1 putative ABC transporter ATP-binding protein YheS [Caulobacter sp. NIBR1757]
MSALITLDSVSAAAPDGRLLFDNLTLAIGRERTGLVGRNGVGKTTLLRLIAGEAPPRAGTISIDGRLAVLRQALQPDPAASLAGLLGVEEALARLARIESGAGSEADFAEADWSLPARLDQALAEVGLAGLAPDRPAVSLSGGQATRAALAAVLLAEPDVILLDEPTNNLDAGARALVADVLRRWKGGALVVSHDRALLEEMDRIVELSPLGARIYGGGYSLYAIRKAEEAAAAMRDLDVAAREAARVRREAQAARERQDQRDAGGRKFAARASEPRILLGAQKRRAEATAGRVDRLADRKQGEAREALEAASARVERTRALAFDLPPSGLPAGRLVLAVEDAAFAWPGGEPLFEHLDLTLTGPERVAITGPNGRGKTTLIRLAAGQLEPTAGTVRRPVPALMLDQRTDLLADDETILEAFRRLNPAADRNAAQAALARFLFRNTAADQLVGSLSGGERLRAALACVLAGDRPPQLLILDEPTNHLDLDSLQAVEQALSGYDGALLVVSHDPAFLEGIGIERRIVIGAPILSR